MSHRAVAYRVAGTTTMDHEAAGLRTGDDGHGIDREGFEIPVGVQFTTHEGSQKVIETPGDIPFTQHDGTADSIAFNSDGTIPFTTH